MKKTFLVQRAKFKKQEDILNNPYIPKVSGIDALLKFDYMGAAEFEYGALPKSLARIRESFSEYKLYSHTFYAYGKTKVVSFLCKEADKVEVELTLEKLSLNSLRLKERCDLSEYVFGIGTEWSNDFWWDIDNDFMFWKEDKEFTENFLKALKIKSHKNRK